MKFSFYSAEKIPKPCANWIGVTPVALNFVLDLQLIRLFYFEILWKDFANLNITWAKFFVDNDKFATFCVECYST